MELKLKRGDTNVNTLTIPIELYQDNMTVYFMAKPEPDDDLNDVNAVIVKEYGETEIIERTDTEITYRTKINPSDTLSVKTDGAKSVKFLGEYEMRYPNGEIHSYPKDDSYIDVIIYADIKRS